MRGEDGVRFKRACFMSFIETMVDLGVFLMGGGYLCRKINQSYILDVVIIC